MNGVANVSTITVTWATSKLWWVGGTG
jgi:hypothetical protein